MSSARLLFRATSSLQISALASIAASLPLAPGKHCNERLKESPLPLGGYREVHVVGGHSGMLQSIEKSLVFKPLQSNNRGSAERRFYEEISKRPAHAPPRCFMPAYHGVAYDMTSDGKLDTQLFIALEDLARPFRRPCLLDVKVGLRTWGDGASPKKIAGEMQKFPLQQRVGFRVTGMRVWDASLGRYREHGRAYGYSLDDSSLHGAFAEFLNDGHRIRTELIPPLLAQLRRLQLWFDTQDE